MPARSRGPPVYRLATDHTIQLQVAAMPPIVATTGCVTAMPGSAATRGGGSGGGALPADDENRCPLRSVCMEAPLPMPLVPCGHVELCHMCSENGVILQGLCQINTGTGTTGMGPPLSVPGLIFVLKILPPLSSLFITGYWLHLSPRFPVPIVQNRDPSHCGHPSAACATAEDNMIPYSPDRPNQQNQATQVVCCTGTPVRLHPCLCNCLHAPRPHFPPTVYR